MNRSLCAAIWLFSSVAIAEEESGFVPLFNGHDLSGWVNANCAPETWSVADGMIHCTGLPTGALRTVRQYENFIFEVDWRHLSKGGNSGIFIWASPIGAPGVPFLRAVEVQVLDHGYNASGKNEWYTTHGDVFPIHGSTMKPFGRHNGMRSFPSEERSNGSPEWNHYRIVCTNGVIRLHVNGKEVSGGEECNYRRGYLGLESEGAPADFRNLRVKELPPSGASPEVTAPLDQGWRTLFTGLDLRGWRTNAGTTSRWSATGEHLELALGKPDPERTLWTVADFGDAEFVLDCRIVKPALDAPASQPGIALIQEDGKFLNLDLEGLEPGKYERFVVTVRGGEASLSRWGSGGDRRIQALPGRGRFKLGLRDTGGAVGFMNLYARDL